MRKLLVVFLLLQIGLFAQLNNTNKWLMRGDVVTLSFSFSGNLTGDSLIFVVKASKDITAVRLIQKTTYDSEITVVPGSTSFFYIRIDAGDTDDLTLAKYYYDITRIHNGDTTTIIIGELNLQPDIGTPFDGTDITGRVTTVSLDNGTINHELVFWDTTQTKWIPSGVTISSGGSVGNADSLGGIPASSYPTNTTLTDSLNVIRAEYATPIMISDSLQRLKGQTLMAWGNSLTEGALYTAAVSNITGVTIVNKGVSGDRIVDLNTRLDSELTANPNLFDDVEYALIEIGTNDYHYHTYPKLGELYDAPDSTAPTFASGLKWAIEKILTANNTIKLFLVTPNEQDYVLFPYKFYNMSGWNLNDMAVLISRIGLFYSVPVVDLYNESGFNEYNITDYTSDGVHYNTAGAERVGKIIASHLTTGGSSGKTESAEVQRFDFQKQILAQSNRNIGYHFDGINDYIVFPSVGDRIYDKATILMTVKTETKQDRCLFKLGGNIIFTAPGMGVYLPSGGGDKINFSVSDGTNKSEDYFDFVPLNNTKYTLAFTINNNGSKKLYVDGRLNQSIDISGYGIGDMTTSDPLVMGYFEATSRYWLGEINDIKIYNRELSADEIYEQFLNSANIDYGDTSLVLFANNTGVQQSKWVATEGDNGILSGATAYNYKFNPDYSTVVDTNYILSQTQRGILNITSNSLANVGRGATISFKQNTSQYLTGTTWERVIGGIKSYLTSPLNTNQSSSMGFYTNDNLTLSERMTLDSGGKLGIGTTTPDSQLTVYGGGHFTGGLKVDGGISATSLIGIDTTYHVAWGSLTGDINTQTDLTGLVHDSIETKQPFDTDLTTYAGITPSANVQTFLGYADFAAMRTGLGLVIGTNVQAFDADLTDLADGELTASKVGGVKDADYGDVTVSSGVWSVKDDSHTHTDMFDTLTISWGVMDTTYAGALTGWKVPNDITITEISAYTDANTCTFNLEERGETTPNTAGTDVMSSDLVADTDQQETSTFSNANIAKNAWLVPTISATGDVSIFAITVRYIKTD